MYLLLKFIGKHVLIVDCVVPVLSWPRFLQCCLKGVQCVSGGLRKRMGDRAVCVCRVLDPREAGEEKHGDSPTLLSSYHHGMKLPGKGPSPQEQGKLDTPIL